MPRALWSVNNGKNYKVGVDEQKELKANQPIHLVLKQDGVTIPIGITHFAELTEDFDEAPFEKTARTINELTDSICKAVKIHESAKMDRDVIITAAGTPFFKNGLNIEIRQGILFIEGRQITFKGEPFVASRLCGRKESLLDGLQRMTLKRSIQSIDERARGSFLIKILASSIANN